MAAWIVALEKQVKELKMRDQKGEICQGGHGTIDCPVGLQEQVDYVGNPNRPFNSAFSNTYNSGWKNHPNFSWKSSGNPPGFHSHQTQPVGRDLGAGHSSRDKVIEDMLTNQT
jgi:hypothetical protein